MVRKAKKSLSEALVGSLLDWNLSVLPPSQRHKMSDEEIRFAQVLLLSIARQSIEFSKEASKREPAEDLFRQTVSTCWCLNPLSPPKLEHGWLEFLDDEAVTSNPSLLYPLLDLLLLYREHADDALYRLMTLNLSKINRIKRDRRLFDLLIKEQPFRISEESRYWLAKQILDGSYVAEIKKTQVELMTLARGSWPIES